MKNWIRIKIVRSIKFFFQRVYRGWDDSETWDLFESVSTYIIPRLKEYQKCSIGVPVSLIAKCDHTFNNIDGKSKFYIDDDYQEMWSIVVDQMILAFEISKEDYFWDFLYDNGMDDLWTDQEFMGYVHKLYEKGMDLFKEYFQHLWW
jgi:hypothetical protein